MHKSTHNLTPNKLRNSDIPQNQYTILSILHHSDILPISIIRTIYCSLHNTDILLIISVHLLVYIVFTFEKLNSLASSENIHSNQTDYAYFASRICEKTEHYAKRQRHVKFAIGTKIADTHD